MRRKTSIRYSVKNYGWQPERCVRERDSAKSRQIDTVRRIYTTKVWIKLHRRSDANRRLTRKIHLVYEGPYYTVVSEIRRNAYLVGDGQGTVIGTYNSRQLRPHRDSRYSTEVTRIDALRVARTFTAVPREVLREMDRSFVQKSVRKKSIDSRDNSVIAIESSQSSPEILYEYAVKSTLHNFPVDTALRNYEAQSTSAMADGDNAFACFSKTTRTAKRVTYHAERIEAHQENFLCHKRRNSCAHC